MNVDELVKQSGVSRSTVFRFLRGNNVRDNAREAIISAMKSLGYEEEKAFTKNLDLIIEVSATEEMDHFLGFTQVINGITFAAEQHGIEVKLCRRDKNQISTVYSNKYKKNKGVIVMGKDIATEEAEAKRLIENNIPHVFVNRVFENRQISFVAVDLIKAGYDITRYLLNMGHKNIAILGCTHSLRADKHKIQGYKDAMSESETKVSDDFCITDANIEELETYIESFFENGKKPDAFVGICDTYAMKFISIAEKHGYKVPDDIAVVGMDDVASSEFFRPALTTIHIPFYEIGVMAVDNLLKQMTKNVSSMQTILGHKIVERESSKRVSNTHYV